MGVPSLCWSAHPCVQGTLPSAHAERQTATDWQSFDAMQLLRAIMHGPSSAHWMQPVVESPQVLQLSHVPAPPSVVPPS
jgi:hypothetical protein